MKKNEKESASAEFIADMVEKLTDVFYDTPDKFFNKLAKSMLWLELTKDEVTNVFNEAVFTIKKTRVTIADILGEIADKKRKSVYNRKTGETTYEL